MFWEKITKGESENTIEGDISISRRNVLYAGTMSAVLGSLAGCSTPLGFGMFDYKKWMYGMENTNFGSYIFSYKKPSTIANYEDEFDDNMYQRYTALPEFLSEGVGIDYDQIENYLRLYRVSVLTLSLEQSEVEDKLDDLDFDDGDEIGGYATYYNENRTRGLAIQDNTMIHAISNSNSEDQLELVIETQNGNQDGYIDGSATGEILTKNLNTDTIVSGVEFDEAESGEGEYTNAVAAGFSASVDSETSKLQSVIVFKEKSDIDIEDIRSISENSFYEIYNTNVSTSGRAAIITGDIDTDDINLNRIDFLKQSR